MHDPSVDENVRLAVKGLREGIVLKRSYEVSTFEELLTLHAFTGVYVNRK